MGTSCQLRSATPMYWESGSTGAHRRENSKRIEKALVVRKRMCPSLDQMGSRRGRFYLLVVHLDLRRVKTPGIKKHSSYTRKQKNSRWRLIVRFVLLRYEDESALNWPPSILILFADEKNEAAELEGAVECTPEYALH